MEKSSVDWWVHLVLDLAAPWAPILVCGIVVWVSDLLENLGKRVELWRRRPGNLRDLDYSRADRRADAPQPDTRRPELLARSLCRGAHDDHERARAIFRWIARNIAYDTAALRSNGPAHALEPDAVLRARRTICAGYADLFEAMARAVNLDARCIDGHSSPIDPATGERLRGGPHRWNAIRLNGYWYLLDVCWGAGGVCKENRFHWQFKEHWFLTPPEIMVETHLPDDRTWTLLPDRRRR